jgi:excinuclease ABC subunit B
MYNGDQQRKQVLVSHGFRLPSAMDNRPLKYDEFTGMMNQLVYVTATPGKIELEQCAKEDLVQQVIRPTGLVDPIIELHSATGQVPHLLEQIKIRAAKGERVLVTTLTKRLAEDLSAYIQEAGIRGRYLHSEIQTVERVEILNDLRKGDFDVLVGINLLREGLDLPEVSLVAILDADKAGFLRSETSLIQTIGRAARNVNARVIMYADAITPAMRVAMDETARRRQLQTDFNTSHGITPTTIQRAIRSGIEAEIKARKTTAEALHQSEGDLDQTELIKLLEEEMLEAAKGLEFERAAQLRDKINEIKGLPIIRGGRDWRPEATESGTPIWQPKSKGKAKRAAAK